LPSGEAQYKRRLDNRGRAKAIAFDLIDGQTTNHQGTAIHSERCASDLSGKLAMDKKKDRRMPQISEEKEK
jgi:hypothetical protein